MVPLIAGLADRPPLLDLLGRCDSDAELALGELDSTAEEPTPLVAVVAGHVTTQRFSLQLPPETVSAAARLRMSPEA